MGIDTRRQTGPAFLVRVLLPTVAVVATVPPTLVGLDAPTVTVTDLVVLPCIALVLAGVGLSAAGTWQLLALGTRAAPVAGLLGGAVLLGEGIAIGTDLEPATSSGLMFGAAGGALAGALLLGVLVRWQSRSGWSAATARSLRRRLVGATVVVAGLVVTRASVPAWLVAVGVLVIVLVGLPLLAARLRVGVPSAELPPEPAPTVPPDVAALAAADPHGTIEVTPRAASRAVPRGPSLRVLHVGAGDAELHRRLAAAGHQVTVLGPRTPGVQERIERHGAGWVRWKPFGVRCGRTRVGQLLARTGAAVVAARHTDADVVVEEFAAPLGSLAMPRWARRPVVGVAMWLPVPAPTDRWAPLHRLRWSAIRSHRSVIVRSPGTAEQLAAAGSRAHVAVISDGIDPAALRPASGRRGDDVVVRVGHLGVVAASVSLLLQAWAQAPVSLAGRLVLVNAGPAEDELRRSAAHLGLAERVEFVDLSGETEHARVASSRIAVVLPGAPDAATRNAALEALAVGTPVLGPDVAVLRDVVPSGVGVLVPSDGDAAGLALALRELHGDRDRRDAAAAQGPRLARVHDLDVLAGQTEDVYLAAVTRGSMGGRDGQGLDRRRLVPR
ncbi:glycosyltransferase family 4 protein [Actinomycetospora sp. C-140]